MKKIFLPYNISALNVGSLITVTGSDYNHIARSLRAALGECFVVGDHDGTEFSGTIVTISKSEVVLRIDNKLNRPARAPLVIAFAILKGDKNEFVIKHCTEIGVTAFIPVLTQHCVARPDEKSAAAKLSRWQQIAKEAAMQSGAKQIPTVHNILSLPQLLTHDLPLHKYFGRILSDISASDILSETRGAAAAAFIGPEGDFTSGEEQRLIDAGWLGVRCPTHVMRSETAAVYFAAVLGFCQNG